MTKAQGRRSNKKRSYYERGYERTKANKARRAAARERRRLTRQPQA